MQPPPRLPSVRLRRLSTVARVDALSVMLIAGLSLPLALWHGGPVISALIAGAVAAGIVEWRGYRRLATDPAAAKPWLVGAQFGLLGVILVYAWYRHAHFDPAALWQELPALARSRLDAQMAAAGLDPEADRAVLLHLMNELVCWLLALLTVFYQGGMVLYYLIQLRRLAAEPLATPPPLA